MIICRAPTSFAPVSKSSREEKFQGCFIPGRLRSKKAISQFPPATLHDNVNVSVLKIMQIIWGLFKNSRIL